VSSTILSEVPWIWYVPSSILSDIVILILS
jgi:hypothetical protein